jgi:hypothetical protein
MTSMSPGDRAVRPQRPLRAIAVELADFVLKLWPAGPLPGIIRGTARRLCRAGLRGQSP